MLIFVAWIFHIFTVCSFGVLSLKVAVLTASLIGDEVVNVIVSLGFIEG